MSPRVVVSLLGLVVASQAWGQTAASRLPSTTQLEMTGDIASQMVAGIDRFLLAQLAKSVTQREQHWQRDLSSAEAYDESIEPNRRALRHMLGVRDDRASHPKIRFIATTSQNALVGRGDGFDVFAVTWPTLRDVSGTGLLVVPNNAPIKATVIAIPDCEILPEQLVGLTAGVPPSSQYARRLAENGCRVIVPLLINRAPRLPNLSNREWLYRSAFELGRGIVGYEVQKMMSLVDWASGEEQQAPIGVIGWGEGGLVALYTAALDTRIDSVCVSGYFAPREEIWREPLDRNIFGLLAQFGDAELATMVAPRSLTIEACAGPVATIAGGRGAPARLVSPELPAVKREVSRARRLLASSPFADNLRLFVSDDGQGPCGHEVALSAFLETLHIRPLAPLGKSPVDLRKAFDPAARHAQQVHELDRHNQWLLRESHFTRQGDTWERFDFSSVEAFERSQIPVREFFYEEVIGRFPHEPLPLAARSREFSDSDQWTTYEVVLDVFPDVFAYGLLLVPKDLTPGERRPVVVCQHGLEGRPQHTIGNEGAEYYQAFAATLAERGFVTFAPQNPYIFTDRFRTLQRKANPLKKTLFSVITSQHQRIIDWLETLEFVDPDRIAFYGLSYGGKTAMRVPAILTDYCLSICSADFNEWVDKNASTRNPRSYVGMGEYEIFEFDLGSTFNYAEMAALIAPRPFMVERGHFDGVADDWTVAHEYAKVRHLYAARLGLGERTEIEWFVGPHAINGQGTFDFLHRHLDWPVRKNPTGD